MTSDNNKVLSVLTRFIASDVGIALIITLAWKTALLFVGYLLDAHFNGPSVTLLHHTGGWDGGWYRTIVDDHYHTNIASAAFYPLFPLLVGAAHLASFNILGILTSGQLVNTLSVWGIAMALLALERIFLGHFKKFWLIALVFSAPAAFFMHVFYGEALFMAIAFWAYIFALRRQWLKMGILLGLLTATRLPSLLIIGLCGLEFMRAYGWRMRKMLNKNALYFLLTPIGFIAYGIYLLATRGDFLGMFHAYHATTDWAYQVFDINIIKTILRISYQIFRTFIGRRAFDMDILINHLLPIVCLLILGVCSLYLLWKKRGRYLPLGVFGLVSIVLFTLNSNVVSVHRYVLPCLTIPIVFALSIKGKHQTAIMICVCTAGLCIQFLLFSLFIAGSFAG